MQRCEAFILTTKGHSPAATFLPPMMCRGSISSALAPAALPRALAEDDSRSAMVLTWLPSELTSRIRDPLSSARIKFPAGLKAILPDAHTPSRSLRWENRVSVPFPLESVDFSFSVSHTVGCWSRTPDCLDLGCPY